jgi:imidazolonepropionase-like amidohydrolase
VLRGGAIEAVIFGPVEVTAGEIVDTTGKTVMPGLIDLHVHLRGSAGPYGFFPEEDHAEDHFKAMLRSGVTSLLDLGTSQGFIFEYRDRIRAGALLAPNLFASGPLLTATGGHPCYSGSPPGDFCLFTDTPADAAAAVDALAPHGPDLIKLVIESGISQPLPQVPDDTVAAVVAAAGAAGIDVIAHVGEAEDLEIGLAAGVRRFAHLPADDALPPALAAALADAGAVVVPTLAVYDALYRVAHGHLTELEDPALPDDVPAEVVAALQDPALLERMTSPEYQALTDALRRNALDNLRVCLEAGVTIAAGTDAGNPGTFHGLALARELSLYVEAGMSPEGALTAGTSRAADLLGRADLGRLAPGAIADVLVVDGDATADIAAVARVSRVYKAGQLLDRPALSVAGDASLAITPVADLGEGATCLGGNECAPGLYCSFLATCDPECTSGAQCGIGNVCFPQGSSAFEGFCLDGDGCDPVAQDCANGEACIWLGNGATLCWYAGVPGPGEPCSDVGTCAQGSQCDFATLVCVQNCDPADPGGGGCPAGQTCADRSAEAGLPVGACG